MEYAEYFGMSPEQAQRVALDLVSEAAQTGQVLGDLPYRLRVLKDIVDRAGAQRAKDLRNADVPTWDNESAFALAKYREMRSASDHNATGSSGLFGGGKSITSA